VLSSNEDVRYRALARDSLQSILNLLTFLDFIKFNNRGRDPALANQFLSFSTERTICF
jgi:hypothetical protein